MKIQKLSYLFWLVFIFAASSLEAQMTKFEKWQKVSYFRGFNNVLMVWSSLDTGFVAMHTQKDFNDLKATGANLVILACEGTYVEDSLEYYTINYTNNDTLFTEEVLDTMVQYCRNAGLHYIIHTRAGPGRDDNRLLYTLWTDKVEQRRFAGMLRDWAEKFGSDSLCVGISMMNEPAPFQSLHSRPPAEVIASLKVSGISVTDVFQTFIDSIRTVDTTLPLIVDGINWALPAYFIEPELAHKYDDPRIVYSVHLYNPFGLTHVEPDNLQEITSVINSVSYPDTYYYGPYEIFAYFDKAYLRDTVYKDVIAFQQKYEVPILVGEFGLLMPQKGGEKFLQDIYDIAIENGWHFALWTWRGDPEFGGSDFEVFDSLSVLSTPPIQSQYWDTVLNMFKTNPTSIGDKYLDVQTPEFFELLQNYPNPFNPETTIRFQLPNTSDITINIYNLHGQLVRKLLSESREAGFHEIVWDARDDAGSSLPSGVYLYRIQAGETRKMKKLMLLR